MTTRERMSKMVFFNIMQKELRQMRWIIIVGLLFGLGLAVIMASTYNYLDQFVDEIPPDMLELLTQYEITRELLMIFSDYSIYVWSQWQAKNLYQFGALFAIIISATQFAGEISKHTIAHYLTRPISRREGYLFKVASGFSVLLIISAGGTIMIWVASMATGHSADWLKFFNSMIISITWLTAYYLIGTIISTMNREPVNAGIITGLVGIILSLPGLFSMSRQYSIFHQMRATEYFIYDQPIFPSIGYGLILIGILLLIGLRVFSNKDF